MMKSNKTTVISIFLLGILLGGIAIYAAIGSQNSDGEAEEAYVEEDIQASESAAAERAAAERAAAERAAAERAAAERAAAERAAAEKIESLKTEISLLVRDVPASSSQNVGGASSRRKFENDCLVDTVLSFAGSNIEKVWTRRCKVENFTRSSVFSSWTYIGSNNEVTVITSRAKLSDMDLSLTESSSSNPIIYLYCKNKNKCVDETDSSTSNYGTDGMNISTEDRVTGNNLVKKFHLLGSLIS